MTQEVGLDLMRSGREGSAKLMVNQSNEQIWGPSTSRNGAKAKLVATYSMNRSLTTTSCFVRSTLQLCTCNPAEGQSWSSKMEHILHHLGSCVNATSKNESLLSLTSAASYKKACQQILARQVLRMSNRDVRGLFSDWIAMWAIWQLKHSLKYRLFSSRKLYHLAVLIQNGAKPPKAESARLERKPRSSTKDVSSLHCLQLGFGTQLPPRRTGQCINPLQLPLCCDNCTD